MRVLVTAVPSVAHILPLLDLAAELQAAGHEVRFATHPGRHALVEDAGFRPVGGRSWDSLPRVAHPRLVRHDQPQPSSTNIAADPATTR